MATGLAASTMAVVRSDADGLSEERRWLMKKHDNDPVMRCATQEPHIHCHPTRRLPSSPSLGIPTMSIA